MNNDQAIEQEIQAKGLTAPRITPDDIEANISSEHYFTAGDGIAGVCFRQTKALHSPHALEQLTFCVIVLRNGMKVVGINYGPVSPENFDAAMGREEARKDAIEQIWPLMGYELRTQLSRQAMSDDNYRMQLKGIPMAVIADFVDDNDSIKGMISPLRED